ncbi:MAG: CidA/LrgA family protein [Prevotellaceae bacterium]|jgi:holin-like protein|nr:CidA/LrgA family protein [Prevotellaceae bacterium]
MIKGLFWIFLFYFLGELISLFIGGFMPGSIIGMILLFLSLLFKLLNPAQVKNTATTISKNMAVFFVPATVGLMTYFSLLKNNFWAIIVSIFVSTLLVMAVVAWIQQRFEFKNEIDTNDNQAIEQ